MARFSARTLASSWRSGRVALPIGFVLGHALVASSAPAAQERELSGKAVRPARCPGSQSTNRSPSHEVGDSLTLGEDTLRVRREGKQLFVAAALGGEPTTAVTSGAVTTLSLSGGRKVPLRFDCDASSVWHYWAAEARQFDVAGTPLRLVDLDCDGRFTLEADGFSAYDAEMVCPLTPALALGASRVTLRSIAPDGATLRVEVVPMEAATQQTETLIRLNVLRARSGLPPVDLDSDKSRACTAHAEYLKLGGWTGYTNPHGEIPGARGATEEGAVVAGGSEIWRGNPTESVSQFWRAYYHRIDLMQPALGGIGVNATPKDIAVVHVRGEPKTYSGGEWPWSDPVTVPGNGAIEFPTTSVSEEPKEPVPDFGHRGAALMCLFHDAPPEPKDFSGRLFEIKGRKEVPVAVLPAAIDGSANVLGVVPEKPLNGKSQYRVVYSWPSPAGPVTRTIEFRTE